MLDLKELITKCSKKISLLATVFLVMSAIPVILNWILFGLSSSLVLNRLKYVFHPLISGFQSQFIWSGFFFSLSFICAFLNRKKTFEKWVIFGFAPFLFLLVCYGIFSTLVFLQITIPLFLVILFANFKIKNSTITFILILILICFNLFGASFTEPTLFKKDNLEQMSTNNLMVRDSIYKNIFYGIIWQEKN